MQLLLWFFFISQSKAEFDVSGIRYLIIEGKLSGVELTIKKGEDNLLKINGTTPRVTFRGDTLLVNFYEQSPKILGIWRINPKFINLKLPQGLVTSFAIKADAVKLFFDLTDLNIGSFKLSFSTGSGVIIWKKENPGILEELSVSTSLGNLEIRHLGYANALQTTFYCGSGKLTLDLAGSWNYNNKLLLFSTLGNLTIYKTQDIEPTLLKHGILNWGTIKTGEGKKEVIIELEGNLNYLQTK